MAVPGGMRSEFIWKSDGNDWAMNVVHWRIDPSLVVDQSLADSMAGHVAFAFTNVPSGGVAIPRSYHPTSVQLARISIQDIRVDNGDAFSGTIALDGTDAGDQNPDLVSLAIQLKTGPDQTNGRVFHWGLSELSNAGNGRPSINVNTDMVGFWNAVRTRIATIPTAPAMAVLSRVSGGVQRPVPLLFDVTAARRSQSSLGTGWQNQRRRRDGLVAF